MNARQLAVNSVRYRTNVIDWSEDYDLRRLDADLADTDDDHAELYAIVEVRGARRRFIYIGIAYDQTVSKRFRNHHVLQALYLRRRDAEVYLVTGRLRTRRSLAETRLIEALLIHRAQPPLNKQGKKSYPGGNLVVVNRNVGDALGAVYGGTRGAVLRWRYYGGPRRAA